MSSCLRGRHVWEGHPLASYLRCEICGVFWRRDWNVYAELLGRPQGEKTESPK